MSEPAIINSLLRVDGFTGPLPIGFERPRPAMDFAMLELESHQEADAWWSAVRTALQIHAQFVRQVQELVATVTLFVETGPGHPVFRVEAPALTILAEAGVALETHRAGP